MEDDRNPFLAQTIDQGETDSAFPPGSKWAVGSSKMMIFALRRNRARDLDHLPLRGAERTGRPPSDRREKFSDWKQLLGLDIGSPQAVEELLVAR